MNKYTIFFFPLKKSNYSKNKGFTIFLYNKWIFIGICWSNFPQSILLLNKNHKLKSDIQIWAPARIPSRLENFSSTTNPVKVQCCCTKWIKKGPLFHLRQNKWNKLVCTLLWEIFYNFCYTNNVSISIISQKDFRLSVCV